MPRRVIAGKKKFILRYRVGAKLRRTIYRDEIFIGIMDSATEAQKVVDLLNLYGGR